MLCRKGVTSDEASLLSKRMAVLIKVYPASNTDIQALPPVRPLTDDRMALFFDAQTPAALEMAGRQSYQLL